MLHKTSVFVLSHYLKYRLLRQSENYVPKRQSEVELKREKDKEPCVNFHKLSTTYQYYSELLILYNDEE